MKYCIFGPKLCKKTSKFHNLLDTCKGKNEEKNKIKNLCKLT